MTLMDDVALLRCISSRTFNVCAFCPHGDWISGYGVRATHRFDGPFGEMRTCADHADPRFTPFADD